MTTVDIPEAPVQDANEIKTIDDVKPFDKRYVYQTLIEPALRLCSRFMVAHGMPHFVAVELKCDRQGDGTVNAYTVHYGNLSPIRELPLMIATEVLAARDQADMGNRIGAILASTPNLLESCRKALRERGVALEDEGLVVQQSTPPVTH